MENAAAIEDRYAPKSASEVRILPSPLLLWRLQRMESMRKPQFPRIVLLGSWVNKGRTPP